MYTESNAAADAPPSPDKKEITIMSGNVVLEELCLTCYEPLVVVGQQAHCPTCQPRLSFVVGYEGPSRYSYTRVDPRDAADIKLAPKRHHSSGTTLRAVQAPARRRGHA